jgi:hypothetical protein
VVVMVVVVVVVAVQYAYFAIHMWGSMGESGLTADKDNAVHM